MKCSCGERARHINPQGTMQCLRCSINDGWYFYDPASNTVLGQSINDWNPTSDLVEALAQLEEANCLLP